MTGGCLRRGVLDLCYFMGRCSVLLVFCGTFDPRGGNCLSLSEQSRAAAGGGIQCLARRHLSRLDTKSHGIKSGYLQGVHYDFFNHCASVYSLKRALASKNI